MFISCKKGSSHTDMRRAKSFPFYRVYIQNNTLQYVPPPLRTQFQFPLITHVSLFVLCLTHPKLVIVTGQNFMSFWSGLSVLFAISLTQHLLNRHIYCINHLGLKQENIYVYKTHKHMFKKKRYIKWKIIWLVLHLLPLLLLGRGDFLKMITS